MATKPAAEPRRRGQAAAPAEPRRARPRAAAAARPLRGADLPHGSARRQRAGSSSSGRARIRVVEGGRVLGRPFLDISDRVHDRRRERPPVDGVRARLRELAPLLGLLHGPAGLHPDRPVPRVGRRPQPRRPGLAPLGHPRGSPPLQPQGRPAPGRRRTGTLFAGFGDGGSGGDPDENAQNLSRMLGKMIRIRPKPNGGYSIPADNPFRGRSGARPEIYAYGLRNPYRFSFDRRRGHLTIGDVGQDEIEEIDFVPGRSGGRRRAAAYNFGWDTFEGRNRYESGSAPGHVPPVLQHSHGSGLLLDHGRLRHPRPLARPRLDGPLRVRRLLRRHAAPSRLRRPARARARTGLQRGQPRLVRRGRPRARLRGLAGRARLPHRPPLRQTGV